MNLLGTTTCITRLTYKRYDLDNDAIISKIVNDIESVNKAITEADVHSFESGWDEIIDLASSLPSEGYVNIKCDNFGYCRELYSSVDNINYTYYFDDIKLKDRVRHILNKIKSGNLLYNFTRQ